MGQRLTIPGTQAAPAAQPTAATPTTKPTAQASGSYVVARGDTMYRIAKKHGVTLAALVAANGITNPNRIYVGQRLTIPGTQAAPAAATPAAQPTAATPTTKVPKTFLTYTYSDATNAAANQNKAALDSSAVPSRAQMQAMVRATAVQMGVDPRLALAHAYVESGFDQRAVSPANAVGVMQVIPSSGEWASKMVGRKLNLLDPQDNVTAGVAIIRYLQNNAASVDQGIAGYYQGLGGVRKYGMREDTKRYVMKVTTAMNRF